MTANTNTLQTELQYYPSFHDFIDMEPLINMEANNTPRHIVALEYQHAPPLSNFYNSNPNYTMQGQLRFSRFFFQIISRSLVRNAIHDCHDSSFYFMFFIFIVLAISVVFGSFCNFIYLPALEWLKWLSWDKLFFFKSGVLSSFFFCYRISVSHLHSCLEATTLVSFFFFCFFLFSYMIPFEKPLILQHNVMRIEISHIELIEPFSCVVNNYFVFACFVHLFDGFRVFFLFFGGIGGILTKDI